MPDSIATSRTPDATTSPASEARPGLGGRTVAHVRVVHSPDPERIGSRAQLTDDLLLLGRDLQGNGLHVHDPRLSRVHARLTFDARAGGYRIGDAQSRNGTFVNTRRIETVLLANGDVIRAGDTLLVYEEGDALQRLRDQVALYAREPATILVRGETGTGKELLARAIHEQSGRTGAFVPVNCATVPAELVGAELFGHTKSAFSGALQARKGIFTAAEGGTLFLDEIGDCPLQIQAALLRALQEKAVRPVGAEREVPVDVRVVAATHADLEAGMAGGSFRPDLYARLAQITLRLPPLRERRGEIIELTRGFADEGSRPLRLSADAAEALLCWNWPFNVRELQSLVRSCQAQGYETLGVDQLHETFPEILRPVLDRRGEGEAAFAAASRSTRPPDASHDRNRLRGLLEQHDGNVSAVADALGKPRAQVYRWMKSMGLSAGKYRK